jgi:hypothetical protein
MAGDDELNLDLTQRPSRDIGYRLEPYDPEPRRDWVRATVTIGLVIAFLLLMGDAGVAAFAVKEHWEQTKEMLQILLPALTGLLGSALGFYFGTKSGERK